MQPRSISPQGIAKLREWEGVSHTAYRDSGGAWTIGVGHLIKPGENFQGVTLTDTEVDNLLRADLQSAEAQVNRSVQVSITQNQFDALVSFAFNVGNSAFANSTLLRKLNSRAPVKDITAEFMRWNKDNGRVVQGLTNRRKAEVGFFWSHLGTAVVVFLVLAAALLFITIPLIA